MSSILNFEKRKTLKNKLNEELMPVAWPPKRWYDWCVSDDKKKKLNQLLLKSCKSVSVVYNMEVLKHFVEECVGSIQLGGGGGRGGLSGHFGVSGHSG